MDRTKWIVYEQTGSGSGWEEAGYVYASNENVEYNKVGTLIQNQLVDGSYSYIHPETKFNYDPITFTFLALDTTDSEVIEFLGYLNSWIDNGTYVKIVDGEGTALYGIFTSLKEVFLTGQSDMKDYQVVLARMAP